MTGDRQRAGGGEQKAVSDSPFEGARGMFIVI